MAHGSEGARPGWAYLVGAGPGDPGLLTLRGAELLRTADLVLHDELVDPAVLRHARGEVRAVGKRGSSPESKQEKQAAINAALVAAGRAGRSVVRLKGGDPFLFGRGAEEVLALRAAGIPFEVVPGIPSPVGATAYAGIPLTHRRLASSVTFVTAVQRDGAPFDWRELAGIRGTVCVFMGVRRLAEISEALVAEAGRAPTTPAALVSFISYPRQRTVTGSLADIAERAADLDSPALLIVGEVVSLREELSWFDRRPLSGKRVLVTRPAHQAEPTEHLLRLRGAEPLLLPTIAIEPSDRAPVEAAARALGDYDLVVFTSDNGVRCFFEAVDEAGLDARAFGGAKVAAIGPATAAGLRRRGIRADIVAETFVAERLADAILAAMADRRGRVLLPRARIAREALPEILRREGFTVDVVPVYDTVTASRDRRAELEMLLGTIDVVMLTSSSTVENLCELLGNDAAAKFVHVHLASIGPITTATAEGLGLSVAVTAEVSTVPGLIDAIERFFADRARG